MGKDRHIMNKEITIDQVIAIVLATAKNIKTKDYLNDKVLPLFETQASALDLSITQQSRS